MNIRDVIGDGKEQTWYDFFKNSTFWVNEGSSKTNTMFLICEPTVGIAVANNLKGLRDELEQMIFQHLGKYYHLEVHPEPNVVFADFESESEKGMLLPGSTPLNPQYTFDNFEISDCNEMVFKSAFMFANKGIRQIQDFRVFFVYGAYGLGKTHILNAIAWEFLKAGKTVAFFNYESFTHYIIKTLSKTESVIFDSLDKLKKVDIFMIDDVHLLSNKPKTQEIAKSVMDHFFAVEKPIAFSSLYSPDELSKRKGIQKELVSRMFDGVALRLLPPDRELREILFKKYLQDVPVSNLVIKNLASVRTKNVRDIKGLAETVRVIMHTEKPQSDKELLKMLKKQGVNIPAVDEQKINAYIQSLHVGVETIEELRGRQSNTELRAIRDRVIRDLIKTHQYSQAYLAELFNLSKNAISKIVRKEIHPK